MTSLRARFYVEANFATDPILLVVAVKLPSGNIETIINTDNLGEKIAYYTNAYDDEFRLKSNKAICIVGFMVVEESAKL